MPARCARVVMTGARGKRNRREPPANSEMRRFVSRGAAASNCSFSGIDVNSHMSCKPNQELESVKHWQREWQERQSGIGAWYCRRPAFTRWFAAMIVSPTPAEQGHTCSWAGRVVYQRCTPDAHRMHNSFQRAHPVCIRCASLVHGVGMALARLRTAEMPGTCLAHLPAWSVGRQRLTWMKRAG